MHKRCLETYLGKNLDNMGENEAISCLECLCKGNNESDCWDSVDDDDTKRMRLCFFPDDDVRKLNKMIRILSTDCEVPPHIINTIKENRIFTKQSEENFVSFLSGI